MYPTGRRQKSKIGGQQESVGLLSDLRLLTTVIGTPLSRISGRQSPGRDPYTLYKNAGGQP